MKQLLVAITLLALCGCRSDRSNSEYVFTEPIEDFYEPSCIIHGSADCDDNFMRIVCPRKIDELSAWRRSEDGYGVRFKCCDKCMSEARIAEIYSALNK